MNQVKTFLFTYQYEGASWLLELKADSAEDARKRLSRLQYAHLSGELIGKIPTTQTTSGALGRFISAFISALGKR